MRAAADLELRLFGVETNTVGRTKMLRELVERMTLLTLAAYDSASVGKTELDEMLKGLAKLDLLLTRASASFRRTSATERPWRAVGEAAAT